MKLSLTISAIFFCISLSSNSQTKRIPEKVFFEHSQICNGGGLWTHEYDLIFELFNDSTLKITSYYSDGLDQYSAVYRYTYTGTYRRVQDSFSINYLGKNFEVKRRKGKYYMLQEKEIPSLSSLSFPDRQFKIDGEILQIGFDKLKLVNASKVTELNTLFKFWDKERSRNKKYFTWPDR